ncbi:ECF RNA polymerase sigma factor SigW [Mariniflexile rhizosphaerae]|uniref:RNA polymerase sigma factor n=1 Tax=unclassified Mariniflexile TaxID=2643887 RepID=UPI000E336F7A|nr:sigma-70 family RNA polymerase sigma factor [Mariniflexile sp. TRM1-10]AXP82046.1 ECF RNA polymerase sigma factor SigW [Mariniflexile sp. TRM1-10]
MFSSQEKFIAHLKKGDSTAYSYLVELYYKKLCDYASNLARDNFKSEDIVQNVIVRMWQNRKNLNHNVSIKNYLYKSVYNEFVDQYRKDIAVTTLEKKYVQGLDFVFEAQDEEETKRLITLIEREIEQLPQKCKETFLLNKKEGLTYIEIAEFNKVSVNTVEKQMGKALFILRKKMKEKAYYFFFMLFGLNKLKILDLQKK